MKHFSTINYRRLRKHFQRKVPFYKSEPSMQKDSVEESDHYLQDLLVSYYDTPSSVLCNNRVSFI